MSFHQGMRVASFGLCSATFALVIASGCGSSDDKKTNPPNKYRGDAGEAGEGTGGTNTKPSGGSGGDGGTSGTRATTGGEPASAGQTSSDGGMSTLPTGGAGNDAGAGSGGEPGGELCPDGFGDCDSDPSDCETPLDTIVQCGGCEVSCSDAHGAVACTSGKCVMTSCSAGYGDCDADGTNGCELALAEDDAHCGACTRDCAAAGSTCNTSMCTPVVIDANASGFLSRMAGGAVYLMQSGAMPVSNYTLVRIPVDGSARKTVWAASGNIGNGALYADETDVYWAVSGAPPSVLKKAATDDADKIPTVVFQPDAQPHYLAAQGANFYWANSTNGLIYARAKNAPMATKGAAIVSVSQGTYTGFVASPSRLFFVVQEGQTVSLKTVTIPAGGAPTTVPDAVVNANAPLATVGEKLYFIRRGNANALNGLYSYTPGDTTVQQLVAHNNLAAFIVDETSIYYKHANEWPLYKVKLAGGVGVAIATNVNGAEFAGQDEKYLYNPKGWGSNGPLQKIVK
jgi:hypothetical protein